MPQLFERVIRTFARDAVETVTSLFFLVICGYFYPALINLDLIFRLTLLERSAGALVAAFVLGKVASKTGRLLTAALMWILFEQERLESLHKTFESFRYIVGIGEKKVDRHENFITLPHIDTYIGENDTVKATYDRLVLDHAFWSTFLGLLVLAYLLPVTNGHILMLVPVTLLAIAASIHAAFRVKRYWADCAAHIKHSRSA